MAKFETFAHVGTEEIEENRRDILSWSRFEQGTSRMHVGKCTA